MHSLSLEKQGWISVQVAHVDLRTKLLHVRMLFDQQPAHVREEEAALRVVRISIGVGELVMNSMIAHPLEDILFFSRL